MMNGYVMITDRRTDELDDIIVLKNVTDLELSRKADDYWYHLTFDEKKRFRMEYGVLSPFMPDDLDPVEALEYVVQVVEVR